jgi:hypothetical protein
LIVCDEIRNASLLLDKVFIDVRWYARTYLPVLIRNAP